MSGSGDDGGEIVGTLAVEQVEGDGEQRRPPLVAVRPHRRAVGVGRRDCVHVRDRGAVAGRGRGEAHAAGHVGIAVEAQMQRADAVPPGGAPGEEHRRLVGIGAGLDEERAAERRIEGLRQPRGEAKLRLVEIDRARVGERAEPVAHRPGHARVVVADGRAHLARVEVEIGLAVGIEDLGAVRADEDRPLCRRNHVRQKLALDQMTRAGSAQRRDVHRCLPSGIAGRDPRAFPHRTETLQPECPATATVRFRVPPRETSIFAGLAGIKWDKQESVGQAVATILTGGGLLWRCMVQS